MFRRFLDLRTWKERWTNKNAAARRAVLRNRLRTDMRIEALEHRCVLARC